jgi:citrate synthase
MSTGEKFYGFGHRIHKTEANEPASVLGKDPRVDFYIRSTLEGFPDKADTIARIVEYAKNIRKLRPNLGANTDFGASVLFTCLGLNPEGASAFFTAFRVPGICANVVSELQVKSNARRPPFPPVLPY